MSTIIRISAKDFRRVYTQPKVAENQETQPRIYVAVVQAANVPSDLSDWTGINPRDPRTKSNVVKKIQQTLTDEPELFVFKNRGLTLLADRVRYDNKQEVIELELADKNIHGLLDGGHTYKVLQNFVAETKPDDIANAYVKIEILEGIEDLDTAVDIVEARNTSNQVKKQSTENLRGAYAAIKNVLATANPTFADSVAYSEYELTEEGTAKSNDILDLLSYLLCFDRKAFDDLRHPLAAYTSKAKVVDHFSKHADHLSALVPLLPVILELRDHIYADLPAAYIATGGKFGLITGVNKLKSSKDPLPYTGQTTEYRIPSSFIYPLLAGFRTLLAEKNDASYYWKTDPIKFWDSLKKNLATRLGDSALEFRNPNKLGKDTALWRGCYDAVSLEAFRRNV